MRLGMGLGLGNLLSGQPLTGFPNDFSFNFDGSNDSLKCDIGSDTNATYTISCWVNADSLTNFTRLIQVDNSNYRFLGLHGDGTVISGYNSGGWDEKFTTATLSTGTWYHLALVDDDSETKIYINGSATTLANSIQIDGPNIFIGSYSGTGNFFDGKIDEVSFFNTALSADDISKICSKPVDLSKASTYATDRTANLKLWLRAGDKVLPESDTSIARSDFYTDFDGTNDYVDVGSQTPINNLTLSNLSFGCWFKTSDTSKYLFGNQDGNDSGFSMEIKSDGKIRSIVRSASGSYLLNDTTSALNDDVWHHIMFTGNLNSGTASGSEGKIYIDGVYEDSASWNEDTTLRAGDSDFTIGTGAGNTSNEFEGQLSSLALYKTALDAQTISQMAKSRYTPMRDNRFSVVDFDGTNDKITFTRQVFTGAFTISWWFNGDTENFYKTIFSDSTLGSSVRDDILTKDSNGFVSIRINGTYKAIISGVPHNEWCHLAFTRDGSGNIKSYLNGVASGTASSTDSFSLDMIGDGCVMSMASASMYNVEKSADEVYAQYQKGITHNPSTDTGLVGLWRMGDDTSKAYPTIADSSSNSNDGTITNGASDDIVQQMVAGYDMGAFESSGETTTTVVNRDFSGIANGTDSTSLSYLAPENPGNTTSRNIENEKLKLVTTSGNTGVNWTESGLTTSKLYKSTITATGENIGSSATYTATFTDIMTANSDGSYTFIGYFTGVSSVTINLRASNNGAGTIYYDDLKIEEVLQSDLSDTYPAIIDVNEPVLGAETITNGTFDSDSSWTKGTGWTIGSGVATSDSSAQSATSYLKGTAFTALDVNKTYKLSFRRVQTNTGGLRMLGLGGSDTTIVTYSTTTTGTDEVVYFKPSGANTQLWVTSLDGLFSGSVDNISLKEVLGNVGTMTQMDGVSNLVYSSVLPDQSFLTGVNSAYNFLDFDGTDAKVTLSSQQSLTGDFTISGWLKVSTAFRIFISDSTSSYTANYILMDNNLDLYLDFQGLSAITFTNSNLPSNQWVHFAITRNAKIFKCYVNGSLTDTEDKSSAGAYDQTWTYNQIGTYDAGQYWYDGNMSNFAIHNKELISTEISAIYNAGRNSNLLDSYSDNLKGYYAFGALDAVTGLADTDNTIYDRSGNSVHGTTSGTATGDLKSPPNAEPNGYAKQDTNRTTTTP